MSTRITVPEGKSALLLTGDQQNDLFALMKIIRAQRRNMAVELKTFSVYDLCGDIMLAIVEAKDA